LGISYYSRKNWENTIIIIFPDSDSSVGVIGSQQSTFLHVHAKLNANYTGFKVVFLATQAIMLLLISQHITD